jgi:threonylcarbamoyladenosine tRNA methylthiotransferase MtaB
MKKVAFKTVGCRLNQAETARIAAGFEIAGYSVVEFGAPADVCVIHTCTITGRAETTCLRLARGAKKDNPSTLVVLAGCAVEANREAILGNPAVDFAIGQKEKFDLPRILAERLHGDSEATANDPTTSTGNLPVQAIAPLFSTTRALVKVQDGCDFCCSYCIVPQVRGTPTSRPMADIQREVEMLARKGFKEIVITGANLAAYSHSGSNLVDVLVLLETLEGIERIRLSSIESSTVQRAVIEFMAGSEKLCRYLHLPLQSGDDGILAAMGRRYTSAQYRKLVEFAAGTMPLIGLGTDIIVGFPGETDEAFKNTCSLVMDLPFNNFHVFPYSIRPGTHAATLPDQLPREIKKERAAELIAIGNSKRRQFALEFLTRPVSALVERLRTDGVATGWTGEYLEARLQMDGLGENDIANFTPSVIDGVILQNFRSDPLSTEEISTR